MHEQIELTIKIKLCFIPDQSTQFIEQTVGEQIRYALNYAHSSLIAGEIEILETKVIQRENEL